MKMLPMKNQEPKPGRINMVFFPIHPEPGALRQLPLGHGSGIGVGPRDRGPAGAEKVGQRLQPARASRCGSRPPGVPRHPGWLSSPGRSSAK